MFKKFFNWIRDIIIEIHEYNTLSNEIKHKAACVYYAEMIHTGLPRFKHFDAITRIKNAIRQFTAMVSAIAVVFMGCVIYLRK